MKEKSQFDIPILLIIYNRFETTEKVFSSIKDVKPSKLYLVSDGPKDISDKTKINELRDHILNNISWDCEFKSMLRDSNLGCKESVSSGIDWFFNNEDMGIILEDDCLPSKSFFYFCEELLHRYKNDKRIYSISGFNQQNEWNSGDHDYFFSKLGNCWGWASWRRCWKDYDVEIKDFEDFEQLKGFENSLGKKLGKIKKDMIYEGVIGNAADSWALQWGYLRHKNSGLTCIPSKSLIKNIGFGDDATHTFHPLSSEVENNELSIPTKINNYVVPDQEYDNLMFKKDTIITRFKNKFINLLS